MLYLKISSSSQGFDLLREAIKLCYLRKDCYDNITNILYPELAKMFSASEKSVERNMRTAIENAYNDNGMLGFNELFNIVFYQNTFKPSNSELICLVVEMLKLKELNSDNDFYKGNLKVIFEDL